ncbi:zinc finger protein 37-like isoform X1 [Centruroides sculpturatus]|uniref:zinc finger protein 37-like isoform X1 n=1 Tax=Centruroides sculpturatus TaxID=218467 RepID=UPI000C6D0CAA|nr:zinc finger protein 37-like isoform X1 [Centruroides sculpturatus]
MESSKSAASESESITDIQNYLATFNKEIQDGSNTASSDSVQHIIQDVGRTAYYLTQSGSENHIGEYHYRSHDQITSEKTEELLQVMERKSNTSGSTDTQDQPTFIAMQPNIGNEIQTGEEQDGNTQDSTINCRNRYPQSVHMVVKQPDGTETEQTVPITSASGSTLITADGQQIHISDDGTLQMVAKLAEQAANNGIDGNNQVILNTGNSYQTVTIVPSDTNPGEVSYVLIVSQPDESKGEKELSLDMSVYDFNEGEKHSELLSTEFTADGTKTHAIKVTPKKSQQIAQPHMCNYCNYTSPKRYLLSRHMKSHSEERPHKCSVCERGFKTLASLQNHVNTHTGTRPHHCKDCPAAFTTSGELVRHVRYKHTHEKPHHCTECDYASVELSKLKRHMRCHTGERPYQCPHCTYASPDTYKLKRHLRIHTGEKPYECNVCHSKFTQSNSLKAHKLIHSGNKPVFKCELCPTTCGRKTDLRIHMQKLHNTDKPLKCKRCGKVFPDRYTYKVHVKTHEGEKCFKCYLCSYASISQRHLESHMLIHTDQKPFCCDQCDQSFRQKQLLRRHKNLYHDPSYVPPLPKEKTHECCECGKSFRHKGNLIRHMAVHDPDASAAEKEEALRIGEPKGPGEQPDGEEDYIDDDYNCMQIAELQTNGSLTCNNESQVVVFEVIQLPNDETGEENKIISAMPDGTVTLSAADTDSQGLTIIQQIPSGSLAEEVAAAIAQVHGDDTEISDLITPLKSEEYNQSNDSITLQETPKRSRGRPRKINNSTHNESNFKENSEENEVCCLENDGDDQMETTLLVMETRQSRKRRVAETGEAENIVTVVPPRKTPNLGSQKNSKSSEDLEEIVRVANDPEEIKRKEAEIVQKKLEQKQKDVEECFGFNDDEEEDEAILAMPTNPGVRLNQTHSSPTMDDNILVSKTEVSHIFNSLQNGNI